MALFDDRRFLLSHINHSFITGDDTGICEVVMLDEDVFENQHQRCLKLLGQNEDEKPEDRLDPQAYDLNYESELFESEQGQSYDIASDLDYICHRRRSNTAQRLERLKKDKINQSKTKTIVWRCNSPTDSQSEERLSHDSPPGDLDKVTSENGPTPMAAPSSTSNRKSRSPPRKSALTRLLERFPSLPKNPFSEYAQYDGGMSETVPVKKIMIFIAIHHNQIQNQQSSQLHSINEVANSDQGNQITTNDNLNDQSLNSRGIGTTNGLKEDSKEQITRNTNSALKSFTQNDTSSNYYKSQLQAQNDPTSSSKQQQATCSKSNTGPLEVVIVSTAKVQDLIGLICWQYTNEGREPKLHHDINRYCLRIAEDNGEVDPDFTSLNPKEPLSKFNFPSLALTEKMEERVRTYSPPQFKYPNGNIYCHRVPSISQNVTTSKPSNASKGLAVLIRFIFKDAKLEADQ